MRLAACLVTIVILLAFKSFGQSSLALSNIITQAQTECQACVDAGTNNFVDCENRHRKTVDSVLNIVYGMLKKQMDPNSFAVLKKDELAWIKKRDQYIHKEAIDQQGDDAGIEANQALLIHKEALFTAERANYLIAKLK
ncbi:MAG: lysozyme inhibitor LprI family protein [Flavipsychrobacter sp.]